METKNFKQFQVIINSYHKKHELCYNPSLFDSLSELNGNHELYQRAIRYLLELGYEEHKLIDTCHITGRDHRTISEEFYDHNCDVMGIRSSDDAD